MNKYNKIIDNTYNIMSMEDIPLTKEDKNLIKKCFDNKLSFKDTIDIVLENYKTK